MEKIGEALARLFDDPCIEAPLVDTRPEPGLQAECAVVENGRALPRCGPGTARPCWELRAEPSCARSGHLVVVRRDEPSPPPNTRQSVKCLTCPAGDPRCR